MPPQSRKFGPGTVLCLCALPVLGTLLLFLQRGNPTQPVPIGRSGPGNVELIRNGGFEDNAASVPDSWIWDRSKTGEKGGVSADKAQFFAGGASLRLEPNRRNGGEQPLAVSQLIPAGDYRGRKVWLSAQLRAEGGAAAVLAILSIVRGKPANLVGDGQPSGQAGWVERRKEYTIPDDPSVQLVVVCSANGTSGTAWFDNVSVRAVASASDPGGAATENRPTQALQASVSVDASRVIREIPETLFGANIEWIWNGNLLWQEAERKPDPRLLRLTQDLGVTLLRYPGGYYSDYYRWKNGVGDPKARPEMAHDGSGRERSRAQFGTDEALDFAKQVGAELLITVNAGTGSAQEAAEWVRHVNANGTRVRYWEVGNELYINDGSPISKAVTVDPRTYAGRFREFASAMKAVDPSIQIGGIGGENRGAYAFVQYRDWNKIVLQGAGGLMDFFAIHNAYAPVSISDRDDVRAVYRAMLAAPVVVSRNLDTVARQIDEYAPKRGRPLPIAVTEWGPLFQVDPKGAYAIHNKTLGSALFAASALKSLIESPRTEIANFHVLNDLGIMGWIGSANGNFPPNPDWTPTPRYYAFLMFSRHFGRRLTRTETAAPAYDTEALGAVDAVRGVPYLEVASSLNKDGSKLYILAINKHFDAPIETDLSIRGFPVRASGEVWTLTGAGIDANTGTKPIQAPGLAWGRQKEDPQNPRFSMGGPGEVTFNSAPVTGVKPQFRYRFPPHSVTSLVLSRN